MKLFKKDKYIKYLNEIVLYKDDMQILNPTEEMVIEDGWVEIKFETYEPTISDFIRDKVREIEDYDTSHAVNSFYVQGTELWLDKSTRAGLKLRFEAELALGKTNTVLWNEGVQFPLSLESAMQMLYALEVYASMCYDNTQYHIAEVKKLETKEALDSYNYTTGYPEKLRF